MAGHNTHAWSPESRATVFKSWQSGKSASQVMRLYSGKLEGDRVLTRSGVIGIVNREFERLGIKGDERGRVRASLPKVVTVKPPKPEKPAKPAKAPQPIVKIASVEVVKVAAPVPLPRPRDGVSIMALEDGMCRFIVSERGADALYCGMPVTGGRRASYCEACRTGEHNRASNGYKKALVADPGRAVTVSGKVAGYARIGTVSARTVALSEAAMSPTSRDESGGGLFNDWR